MDGDAESSLPPLARARVSVDFRDADAYFVKMFELLLTLFKLAGRPSPWVNELRAILERQTPAALD